MNPSGNADSYNTAVGFYALYANTIGYRNTAVGGLSLDALVTGNNNTAIGYAAATSRTVEMITLLLVHTA